MKVDTQQLRTGIEPLAIAHGVELVALEWLQGPGRGILRLYIDAHGADPRTPPDERAPGATADVCAGLSRDVSAWLDSLGEETFPMAYDLEVSSPGFERPVQKRADFDRFVGLVCHFKLRRSIDGRTAVEGELRGTRDLDHGDYAVTVALSADQTLDVSARNIARARLAEIKFTKPAKPKAPRKNRAPDPGAADVRTRPNDHDAPPAAPARDGGDER